MQVAGAFLAQCPGPLRAQQTPAIFGSVKLYSFDGVDAALGLLPLAARRALDVTGLKVSLEAWRALPLESRRALVEAGAGSTVDVERVTALLPAGEVSRIEPLSEPRE